MRWDNIEGSSLFVIDKDNIVERIDNTVAYHDMSAYLAAAMSPPMTIRAPSMQKKTLE